MEDNFTSRMRLLVIILATGLALCGCNMGRRERELREKEAALALQQQQLQAREQELNLRAEALDKKEQLLDSTRSAHSTNPALPAIAGTWEVQMTCTETTCAGSAVGDTKTEQWEIAQQEGTIVAQAMANGQLVRVYTGNYQDGTIQLTEEMANAASPALAKMVVRLKPVSANRMEGEREIIRENNCRIVYDLQLNATTK